MRLFSAAMLARRFNVKPRRISDLFYQGKLDGNRCPVISGRRLIPSDYLPEVERALREAGYLCEVSPC